MTELKKFLFDFNFDDVRLMEEIDQAENKNEISTDDCAPIEPEPEAPTFSEEDMEVARQNGFAAGKKIGVQESLGSVENTICEILDTIATGISGVAQDQNAFNEKTENKLLNLVNKIKKKNTLLFLEYRNHKDLIFKNIKNKKHNQLIEFEKGHFRRIIYTEKFIKKISKFFKGKIIFNKSAKNLSIVKKDNPNLSRIIFKF